MNILMTSTGGTVGKLLVDMAVKSAEITSVCIVDAAFSPSHIKNVAYCGMLPYPNEKNYFSELSELIEGQNIDYVLPLSEEDSLAISEFHKIGALSANYIGCDNLALGNIVDKVKCYEILSSHNILVPRFLKFNSLNEFQVALSELDYPKNNVVIKPIKGRGSRGVRILSESINLFEQFLSRGPQVFSSQKQVHSNHLSHS